MEGSSPVGWLCLVPPILTIGLAIATRRVVISLLAGIAAGVLILLPNPEAFESTTGSFSAGSYLVSSAGGFVREFVVSHLLGSLLDFDHLLVFAFTSILGIQVALIHRTGGMLGIVRWAAPMAKTRRGGQVLTFLLGLVVFIDDYANTLLLGSTMRPITDRLKISREKLAFLVDTTAAPVSGIALVSTWVATEISSMETGFNDAGIEIGNNTFGIFLSTIPSRFYILYALAFVFVCAVMCRDFGPMLTAERKARADDKNEPKADDNSQPGRPWNAIFPITITVAVVIVMLAITGLAEVGDSALPDSTIQAWGAIIGQGNSYVSLVYGSLAGLAFLGVLIAMQRDVTIGQVGQSALEGFRHVLPAMIILWLAWALSGLTKEEFLGTGNHLAARLTEGTLSPALMPTIVFVLASAIAFSTGTSWGTMAILMPIVIPLVYTLIEQTTGTAPAADHYIITASIGSVLAGAIFGDHCSPISDTTILSSRSSDCDHIAHVRTQIPYALTIGAVAILLGTLPAGFGISSLILLPLGCVSLIAILLIFGRTVDATGS